MSKCNWKNNVFSSCKKLENELREDLFEAASGAYGNYCKWCGADIRRPEPEVIIKQSGGTWVSRFDGVDYMLISHNYWITMNPPFKTDGDQAPHVEWKPISEITITDEIAKLRPICYVSGWKWFFKLLGFESGVAYGKAGTGAKEIELTYFRLATISDLNDYKEDQI